MDVWLDAWLIVLLIIIALAIYSEQKRIEKEKRRRRENEFWRRTCHKKMQTFSSFTPQASNPGTYKEKGRTGELALWRQLQNLPGYKKVLLNCYLPTADGRTSEADVILLHESGLYVLESKNYSGWIFGTETQRNWVQSLPPDQHHQVKKVSFYNPIRQNEGHLKWLEEYLKTNFTTAASLSTPLYSVIVFGNACELKNICLTSGRHFVVQQRELLSVLTKNAANSRRWLSKEQIDQLCDCMQPLTQVSEETRRQHIRDVQQKKAARPAQAAAWKTVSLQANASAQPSPTQGLAAGPATASAAKKREAPRQNTRTENAVQAAAKPQNTQAPGVQPLDGRPQAAPAQAAAPEQIQTAPPAEPLPTADKPAQPQPTAAQPAAEAPELPADEKLSATAVQPTAEAVQAPPQTTAASAADTAESVQNTAEGAGMAAGTPAGTLPEQSSERPTEEIFPKQQEAAAVVETAAAPQAAEPAAASAALPPTCPWCGGRLVQRTARKGARAGKPFYGCSAYPACRYIRNID